MILDCVALADAKLLGRLSIDPGLNHPHGWGRRTSQFRYILVGKCYRHGLSVEELDIPDGDQIFA